MGIQQLDRRGEAGEVFGFLGPNGAGKTTTIRCLVWSGNELRLLIRPDELLAALRRLLELPVTDIAVEEAGLDEAFLAFYRQAEAEAAAQARPRTRTA